MLPRIVSETVNDDRHPRPLNAFLDLPQVACSSAQSGPLAGLRLAVKDIFDVAGYRTGCGNPRQVRRGRDRRAHRAGGPGAARSGRAIRRQDADRRTRLLADGHNAHFPPPVNPTAPDRVTGGSSSRLGGGGRRQARRHRHRLGHRRLDPRTGELLRADRAAHHAWPHLARRHDAAGALASTRSAGSPTTSRPTRRSAASCSAATRIAASSTRPLTMARLDALVLGKRGGRRL